MNPFFAFNQLRNNRDIAPENRSGISRETSWKKHMEEARYLEVAKKIRGTLDSDQSNTTCSALGSVQRLHIVQHLHSPFCVPTENLK